MVKEINGGTKYDEGKLRMDLVAPEGVEGIARVLTFGANKYGDRNWEKGMSWGRAFAATLRHLYAWWGGQDIDPESGFSHLDHAACNIHFLQAYEKRNIGTDSRNKKAQPENPDWANCDKNLNAGGVISVSSNPSYYGPDQIKAFIRDRCDPFKGGSCPDSTGSSL
jgi:hypothetical protein